MQASHTMSEAASRSAPASTSYPVQHRQPRGRKRRANAPAGPVQLWQQPAGHLESCRDRETWIAGAATLAAEEAVQDTVHTEKQHIQQLLDR